MLCIATRFGHRAKVRNSPLCVSWSVAKRFRIPRSFSRTLRGRYETPSAIREARLLMALQKPAGLGEVALPAVSRSAFAIRGMSFVGVSCCFGVADNTSRPLPAHFWMPLRGIVRLTLCAGCLSRKELRDNFVGGAGAIRSGFRDPKC